MDTQQTPNEITVTSEPVSGQTANDFDPEWETPSFTPIHRVGEDASSVEDWEDRFNENTSGYVSSPLTTSFTDLDLGPAQLELRNTAEWADLSSWADA